MTTEPRSRAPMVETGARNRGPEPRVAAVRRSVLVVEDEEDLARVIRRHIEDIGCQVRIAPSGESALEAIARDPYDLVLLDVMLPGIDGLEVCRRLRARYPYLPVVMLTARSSEIDKVLGLETGADDYLTKPFGVQELLARIKAIFRRMDSLAAPHTTPDRIIQAAGCLRINPATREVFLRDRAITLTHREFDLLRHFAENPGRVYTRAQLLDAVWGYSHEGYEHAVNCHINRLRAKIEPDPGAPRLLLTAWGVGYKFTTESIDPE